MKKILVTVVLGVAALAAAQDAAKPAQGQPSPSPAPAAAQAAQAQPAAPASQAPIIKDPQEYNAYVNAIQQKDPATQISGLEAFLTQYPSSIMKVAALQTLMQDYQQTNNQAKTVDAATRLVAADPTNERAIFLLAYFDRLCAQSGGPNAKQCLGDAKKYGQMGMDGLPKFAKPDGTSDADFQKMKDQMTGVFNAALGLAALTDSDYDTARKDLRAAIDSSPDSQKDFTLVYALTQAYVPPKTPDPKFTPDPVNAIWFNARASVLAPTPPYQQSFEKYAKSLYMKYHGGDDGWADVLAQAKAGATTIPTIAPAPTPAEQAHSMVLATAPDKMDFATWEFVLSNGKQEDQDAVWGGVKDKDGKVVAEGIKGKAVYMNGTIISATATEFLIAASSDDIEAKKADITLTFEEKVPLRLIPKAGASLDFQGNPASYTSTPFMMTMEKGLLPKPKTAAPAHHKPASN
jgi:tetratricopeptide (TPR) repeat protein